MQLKKTFLLPLILLFIFTIGCSEHTTETNESGASDDTNSILTASFPDTTISPVFYQKIPIFHSDDDPEIEEFKSSLLQAINNNDSALVLSYIYQKEPYFETITGYKRGRHWLPYYFYSFENFKTVLKRSITAGFKEVVDSNYHSIPYDMIMTDEPVNEISGPVDGLQYEKWSPHKDQVIGTLSMYPELKDSKFFVNFPFTDPVLEVAVERMESIVVPGSDVPLTEIDRKVIFRGEQPEIIDHISDTILKGCKYHHKYFTYDNMVEFLNADHPDSSYYIVCSINSERSGVSIQNSLGAMNMYRVYICKVNGKWKLISIRLPGKYAKGVGC